MAGEWPKHLKRVRALPCCSCGAPPPSQAHHRTGAGMGLRSNDMATMPLCVWCHGAFHSLSGPFKGFDKATRRAWEAEKISETLEAVA